MAGVPSSPSGAGKQHKSLFQLTMLTSIVAAATFGAVAAQEAPLMDKHRPAISYCDDTQERTVGRRLLYVTTLDGRLSALDITKGGKKRWSIPTGPGPLISSSIHRLELTNNGRFVRMIPSLSGGIYKFDGETIDPLPITTDHLLSSSSKFSDDLVISGGKETRTYGVSARTGQLLYECSMHGCVNSTDALAEDASLVNSGEDEKETETDRDSMAAHDPLVDDVIVVRRQTQTVRAVESRTGVERWNFSVGQHEVDILRSPECHDRQFSELDMAILDLDVKVIVPDGVIYAFSKANPTDMLWKYKFDHPIVSAWRIDAADELSSIDMFGSATWLWEHEDSLFDPPFPAVSPSIYLGMYERQLYIQESVSLRKEIVDQSNLYHQLTEETDTEVTLPTIPWRPVAANPSALVLYQNDKVISGNTLPPYIDQNGGDLNVHGNELMPYDEESFAVSAQSVLNGSEYVNGNGFYLYTHDDLKKTMECNDGTGLPAIEAPPAQGDHGTNQTMATPDLGFNLDDIDEPVKVVILSLWFWWKEIVVIAFTSALLVNVMFLQRQRPQREIVVIERHIPVPTAMEATESSTAALLGPTNTTTTTTTSTGNTTKTLGNGLNNGHRSLSECTTNSSEQYSSRFQGDFDLMRCLGRGGFGVVFEAKNKLDDCKYAVKRITLPNKKESRERVMREVKTLANCEHQNIVRYFQAWVENPPPGWQEEEDGKWLAHELSTSIQIETPDGTTLPSLAHSLPPSRHVTKRNLQIEKKKQLMSWVSSLNDTACSSDYASDNEEELRRVQEEDEDDSCIVFRTESQSKALQEEEHSEVLESINGSNCQKDSISIDIHSNSFGLSFAGKGAGQKPTDYSQLSDSFQIEFVRTTNGVMGEESEEEEGKVLEHQSNKMCNGHERKRRSLALDVHQDLPPPLNNHNNNSNHCKALLPMAAVAQPLPPQPSPKPTQNKVYLYIQMQLCRKESLRDWLRDNRRDARLQHIGTIFYQIVDAVDYVHLKGLIHRDLKPSNIFFSQDGQIKIGDFGLVTDMSDIPNMVTKCGDGTGLPSCARHTQQVGTHLYMSPEQLRGKHYDYKVDIYSLGLIFFELLVFFGTEMERVVTLRELRDGQYPKEFPVEHPAEHDLLKRMLSQQPEERPTTTELKVQLKAILKLPDSPLADSDAAAAAALAEAARRLSRSRTFSTSE